MPERDPTQRKSRRFPNQFFCPSHSFSNDEEGCLVRYTFVYNFLDFFLLNFLFLFFYSKKDAEWCLTCDDLCKSTCKTEQHSIVQVAAEEGEKIKAKFEKAQTNFSAALEKRYKIKGHLADKEKAILNSIRQNLRSIDELNQLVEEAKPAPGVHQGVEALLNVAQQFITRSEQQLHFAATEEENLGLTEDSDEIQIVADIPATKRNTSKDDDAIVFAGSSASSSVISSPRKRARLAPSSPVNR